MMHNPIKRLLLIATLVATGACVNQSLHQPEAETLDVIITGGTTYDGDGNLLPDVDIGVRGSKIVAVQDGLVESHPSHVVINARGLIAAPGFIDPHTHADSDLGSQDSSKRANLPFAFQGISTVVVGNDGYGTPQIANAARMAGIAGIGTNVAYLAGFAPIREATLGKTKNTPDPDQMKQMKALLRIAMCEGAWGFSTGLYYVPQNFAAKSEVIDLATVAGRLGGYYDTHIRDEGDYTITVTSAVEEALEIGRRANLPVHISHIKALGPAVWGHSARMIEIIEDAQASGMRVTADQYPWEASGTRISNALVPRWALEGGLASFRERLKNSDLKRRIVLEMGESLKRRGGADKLMFTGRLGQVEITLGETLAELAQESKVSPVEAAVAILEQGDARVASFNMTKSDIAAFAEQDWVVTGSDGSLGHPRKYASFPKAYRDLVRNGEMSLSRFIHRSSGQTAEIIGLKDRGFLRPGFAADIVIFDPEKFAPRASYEMPREHSVGVRYLFVNGRALISNGEFTGNLPGDPLLKETLC